MTHHEIVQAILDGKSLDMRDLASHQLPPLWQKFCTDGTSGVPLFKTLETLMVDHKHHEFRIRPTTVTKTYTSRAYLIGNCVFHWVSTDLEPQSEVLKPYGGQAWWIEETQYKTYEVTL